MTEAMSDSTDHTYLQGADIPQIEPPQRVVSLVPSVTESMFDLNLGNRLIAVTDYCVYPAEGVAKLPHIGGTKNPQVDQVIALQPDLVIANREENRKQDVEALRGAEVTVWVTFPKTVSDAFTLLWDMMNLFDEQSMVPRIRLMEYTYDWLNSISLANEERLPRVFVPIWFEPWMTFNADTFIHDLLRVCGGKNVFGERDRLYPLRADLGDAEAYASDDPRVEGRDTRYPRVTLEEILQQQPDVVLLPSEPFPFDASHVELFHSLDIPAAAHNRIYLVDGSLLTWHGTRLAYAFDTLPALLTPTEVS
jgi:ABC-type Fe3+-hydroxamate transport system substrate-binding protein